jgi:hypothetical protein
MTHMDDQVAKHVKAMIHRIRRKPTENHDGDRKPDTLDRVVRILRRGPEQSYDPVSLTYSSRWDAGS